MSNELTILKEQFFNSETNWEQAFQVILKSIRGGKRVITTGPPPRMFVRYAANVKGKELEVRNMVDDNGKEVPDLFEIFLTQER